MRLATSFTHREFFFKNGCIEFESLISLEECSLLLSKPLGRDLWRKDSLIKKISTRRQFGEIATVLSCKKMIRIAFDQRINKPFNLQASCLEPVIALQIPLSGEKVGSGIFLSPTTPLLENDSFLIVYCESTTVYQLNSEDPYTHSLKRLGYVFGDRVRNDTHPLITF